MGDVEGIHEGRALQVGSISGAITYKATYANRSSKQVIPPRVESRVQQVWSLRVTPLGHGIPATQPPSTRYQLWTPILLEPGQMA